MKSDIYDEQREDIFPTNLSSSKANGENRLQNCNYIKLCSMELVIILLKPGYNSVIVHKILTNGKKKLLKR